MKHNGLTYLAAAAICTAWILNPTSTRAERNHNLSVNFEGSAQHCSDLRVRSNGEFAQANDVFTMTKAQAPILEMTHVDQSVIHVMGEDRADYSVEACKVAAADTRAAAEQAIRGIAVNRTAGQISSSGPAGDDINWQVYFIVHAPKDANLDLETKNGPISVENIMGQTKLRAQNGPVSVRDCTGLVEVHTTNGPISFNGGGGEVHLNAQNGPISLKLAGEVWNGSQLEARTVNGPVSIIVPDGFRSGVRVETDGHSPISCAATSCRDAIMNAGEQRVIHFNGSQDTIRVSTSNGPVSVNGGSKGRRII